MLFRSGVDYKMNDQNRNENCCIGNILEVITILQNKAEKFDDIPSTCDRPFLGTVNNSCLVYNTRPVTLYNCNNMTMTFPYTIDGTNGTSDVLRCEKVEGCCATCRILAPNTDTTCSEPYVATDSFCTINLDCCCSLRCLDDTFVACI